MDKLTAAMHGLRLDDPICVDPARVHLIWPHAEGLIDSAFRKTDLDNIEVTKADVLSGRALLWIVWDGVTISSALVTKIVKPHHTKFCIFLACGGKGSWPALIETIEDYARAQDCAFTRIYGRKGWLRVLKNYKATRFIMDCEL